MRPYIRWRIFKKCGVQCVSQSVQQPYIDKSTWMCLTCVGNPTPLPRFGPRVCGSRGRGLGCPAPGVEADAADDAPAGEGPQVRGGLCGAKAHRHPWLALGHGKKSSFGGGQGDW